MDILIDLIIWIIRTAANSSEARKRAPSTPQEADRRRALEAQLRALGQPARAPAPNSRTLGPTRKQPAKPTNWGVPTPPRWVSPAAGTKVATGVITRAADKRTAPPARQALSAPRAPVPLRIPLILGEILDPPVALREPEF